MNRIDRFEDDGETAAKFLLWLSLILTVIFFAGVMWIGYECLNDSKAKQSLPDQCCWDCIGGRLVPVDHVAVSSDRTNATAGSVVAASGDRFIQ